MPIALVELVIEFSRLWLIQGATEVVVGAGGESTTPRFRREPYGISSISVQIAQHVLYITLYDYFIKNIKLKNIYILLASC